MKITKQSLIWLLTLYIFFLYNAQETLFPTQIHSVIMLAMVALTIIFSLFSGKVVLNDYTKWYIVLTAISGVSLIYASHYTAGALYTMAVALVITFCFTYIIRNSKDLEIVISTFVYSSDTLCILLALTGQIGYTSERLGTEVSGNANAFSALLMVASIFACWKAIFSNSTKHKIVFWGSFFLNLLFMALSGGRKTIIAVLICAAYFLVTKEGHINIKTIRNIALIVAGLYLMNYLVMNVPLLYEVIGERFKSLFIFLSGGQSSITSDIARQVMIKNGLLAWKDRPLLGYGLDNYRYYNAIMTGRFYYAHNNYVELLYDIGLVGFIIYYSFFVITLKRIKNARTLQYKYKTLGIGLILELLVFDIGGVSYYQVLSQIVLCIAFVATTMEDSEEVICSGNPRMKGVL